MLAVNEKEPTFNCVLVQVGPFHSHTLMNSLHALPTSIPLLLVNCSSLAFIIECASVYKYLLSLATSILPVLY